MSETAWNLAELRTYARTKKSDSTALFDLINSIDRSTRIFGHHLFTARDAMKGIINDADPCGEKNFLLVLGVSEQQEEFAHAKIVSEAHIIGCFHTARSLLDIFSHLLNELILEKQLPVHLCDIHKVATALPASELKDHLDALLSSHWFNYLSGFINTTKHRQLVQHEISISFEKNLAGIRLRSFVYRNVIYPTYWAPEALSGVLTVKNSVITMGRALNKICIPCGA